LSFSSDKICIFIILDSVKIWQQLNLFTFATTV